MLSVHWNKQVTHFHDLYQKPSVFLDCSNTQIQHNERSECSSKYTVMLQDMVPWLCEGDKTQLCTIWDSTSFLAFNWQDPNQKGSPLLFSCVKNPYPKGYEHH